MAGTDIDEASIGELRIEPASTKLELTSYVHLPSVDQVVRAFTRDGDLFVVSGKEGGRLAGYDRSELRGLVATSVPTHLHELKIERRPVVENAKSNAANMLGGRFWKRIANSIRSMPADELLEWFPDKEPDDTSAVLASAMEEQMTKIESMEMLLNRAHSWSGKVADWLGAGIIGAVVGIFLGLVWNALSE